MDDMSTALADRRIALSGGTVDLLTRDVRLRGRPDRQPNPKSGVAEGEATAPPASYG